MGTSPPHLRRETTTRQMSMLHWMFDDEGRATPNFPDEDPQLTVSTGTSTVSHTIHHFPHHKAHKTLGVYLSTDFQTSTALQHLQRKYCNTLPASSKAIYLDKRPGSATLFAFSPSWTHKHKDLYQLQRPAVATTSVKLGFRRTINLSIVFGSPRYGGLGLRDLFLEQGIA
jgi:hypothetical protein